MLRRHTKSVIFVLLCLFLFLPLLLNSVLFIEASYVNYDEEEELENLLLTNSTQQSESYLSNTDESFCWDIEQLEINTYSVDGIPNPENFELTNEVLERTVYYIDFENGDDSNNGITAETAWKHAPGDINAAGNPLNYVPMSGDTFLFRGGVEYKGQIELKHIWNGTEEAPIIYDGNSSGTWGEGKAIMDGDDQTFSCAFRMLSHWQNGGLSYVDIKNFIIQDYSSVGIDCNSASYVNITDIYIHDLSNWDFSQCVVCLDTDARSGCGISLRGESHHINIDNCEITKVGGIGISIKNGVHDIDVGNVKIHDYIVWQLDISPSAGYTISNINIHDSEFYNLYHYSNRYWARALIGKESHQHLNYTWNISTEGENEYYVTLIGGDDPEITTVNELWYDYEKAHHGIVGRLNPGEWAYADNDNLGFNTVYIRLPDGGDPDELEPKDMINIVEARYDDKKVRPGSEQGMGNANQDGIFVRNPQGGTLENIRIYNNDFYDEERYTESGGTAMLYISQPKDNDSIYVYNNVFHPVHLPAMSMWLGSGEIHIYNNTFIGQGIGWGRPPNEGPSETKLYIKNNAIYSEGSKLGFRYPNEADVGHLESDFNIFSTGDRIAKQTSPYKVFGSLEEWQEEFGQDLNSIVVEDIRFINRLGPCPPENSDYRLIPDSLAIDNGIELGPDFLYDKIGNLRGEDGGWDIGAYEFQGIDHPVANFTYSNILNKSSGYEPFEINFDANNSYVDEGREIVSYDWDFGDGNTASGAVVNHTFFAGEHTVSLIVTDNKRYSHNVSRRFNILPSEFPNLYLYLPLDGNYQDASGKNMRESWQGTPLYEDVLNGQAARFNQDNSRGIKIEHNDYLDGMEELSIAFWAKKEDLTASTYVVFKYGVYEIFLNEGGLGAKFVNTEGEDGSLETSSIISDTGWHHYTITYDGSSIVIYVDGNEILQREFSGRIKRSSSRDIYIGRNPWGGSLDGMMDDIRIYDKAITQEEIRNIAASNIPANFAPVIKQNPSSQAVVAGRDITLSVTATGYPEPTYQWKYNGVDIAGATTSTYTISNIQFENQGEYSVSITNSAGSIISNSAFITVIESLPGIDNLNSIIEYYSVYFSWDNPYNQEIVPDNILVIRKEDTAPTKPDDGVEVYNGPGTSYIDFNIREGNYYYAVYTYNDYDTNIVYSDPVIEEVSIPNLYNKEYLHIDMSSEHSNEDNIKIGQNTRGDLYTLWNEQNTTIGRGITGNATDLWIYSNVIGNAENQIPYGSDIVSARLVFKIKDSTFVDSSASNYAAERLPVVSGAGKIVHGIKVYKIIDPDNLGIPHYAEESGIRTGLNFYYRDHRPGINIPWQNQEEDSEGHSVISGDILNLFDGVEQLGTVEFYPEVFVDEMLDTIQFDITEAVQAWSDGVSNQGLFITTDQGWKNGELLHIYGVTTDVNEYENDNEDEDGGQSDNQTYQPYIEIIYADSDSTLNLIPPDTVSNLTMKPGIDSITLKWTNPDNSEPANSDFAGVKIVRQEGIVPFNEYDGEMVTIMSDDNIANIPESYTDTGLTAGKAYYYAIYTFDDQHNYSQKVWLKGIPGAPAAASVLDNPVAGPGRVSLSWSQVDGADKYYIYRKDSRGDTRLLEDISSDQTFSYIDYVSEGEYTYWLTAVNQYGEGPLSDKK
ncbi:MAG: LamG-like jellyroll fold domain-containing protein, partial [Halanaerobiales bacterium]